MINNKTLLSSALSLTLLSTISMAADFYSDAGFQNSLLNPSPDLLLPIDEGMECQTIDDSTENAWNAGELCFASDTKISPTNFSVTNSLRRRARLAASQDILGDALGAQCISAGDSAATTDFPGGFCLAADLNTSVSNLANFSVANELPVAGMQYIQALFSDGSTMSDSAPVGSECVSAGGSISLPDDSNGFCLASDLNSSTTAFANFSIANGIPLVGIQFIQVLFDVTGASTTASTGAKCSSVGGSAAASGSTAGFCLASDLSTSTAGFANIAVAHDLPVTDLQFLQMTFEIAGTSESTFLQGAGASVGAECISVDGSIAAIGNPKGFCLVSDLIETSINSADITIANNLPVSGMQFLQVKFDNGTFGELPPSPIGAECVSNDGSTASAGNPEGFCLVADLINSTMESANISVANDLPVVAWEFLQVPSENVPPIAALSNPDGAVVPEGVVVSGFEELPFNSSPEVPPSEITPPAVTPVGISSSSLLSDDEGKIPFFHFSDQTNGIETFTTPYWRTYPHLGLWVGR